MRKTLSVCAALLVLPLASRAADAPEPTETVIRMKVQAVRAPKPALKYQLLPELREMNPGNPIQAYSKCFAEQYNWWRNKEVVEKREKWQTMPLKDLPLKEIQYYRGNPLRYADYAARLDTPDWQILLQLKSEGPFLLLPDLQGLRELAGALKVRFRMEVAEGRFDDALATAKTMFGLSRHLGEHPSLIGELVGMAVANLALGPLDEMIQQPGSPNLFWALTNLPQPFISLRNGVQGDRTMMTSLFALIDEREPMTDAQVQRAMVPIRRMVKDLNMKWDEHGWFDELTKDEARLCATRKRLIEAGLAKEKVKQFSARQVILLDEKLEFSVWRDESRKALSLPYWQAAPILAAASPRKENKHSPFRWEGPMGYDKVKQLQARLDQRIGLLRCVEALRLYAAEHDGKLPARLADMKLPLPVDPITGKPFVYKLDGVTAILRGTPPAGREKTAAFNVRYEVTIAK
ncbi:MAG TPA: hypothetical protein VN688_11550 [Gemmataceae bacterium]|nr:hypothetical protein [Gemmataceae bacterium]